VSAALRGGYHGSDQGSVMYRTGRNAANTLLSGQKRTSRGQAKSVAGDPYRRFATANCRTAKGLFDHLVGDGEHVGPDLDAERSRRLQVDGELKFSRLLHRQVGGLRAFEDFTGVDADLTK
jgi:hypothetical protein